MDLENVKHFVPSEKLVNVLMQKTQIANPIFFRVLVAYYFAKVASIMHTNIKTHDRGIIPVNLYAINLAPSGFGKGFSTNILEEEVISNFKHKFMEETFPILSESCIAKIAASRANKYGEDYEETLEKTTKEFNSLGHLAFSFDSGTSPAVKQMRQLILMSGAGAVSLELDEIGSNLVSNIEVLNTFLELYDIGNVKQKLTKNTKENVRSEEVAGRTPTNMLLFGTPNKVLDGGKTQEELISMLDTGYARRCFFGYIPRIEKDTILTPEQIYDMMTDTTSSDYLEQLAVDIGNLADESKFGQVLTISKSTTLKLIEYRLYCDHRADELGDFATIQKAELSHRYFKALKLAGAYAFISESDEITEELLFNAIKLAEETGDSFGGILNRDRNYTLLAKYIAGVKKEVTEVDLIEDLPFYKGTASQRSDLMHQASAWGYKNNIIIKRSSSDGIEFFSGESLEDTDLDNLTISYSTDITTGYEKFTIPFDGMHELLTEPGYHYCNHHFVDDYRSSSNVIQGFNMVVLDVDDSVQMETAQMLLEDYTALFATTKRHTDSKNRYRIILPLSHTVKLPTVEFSKFMENIYAWLPFNVDVQAKDIARKWMAHPGSFHYQEGELLDAMLFIPQTRKEGETRDKILSTDAINNLERWFILKATRGNRSNSIIRYALALVDSGKDYDDIRNAVIQLNDKITSPMKEEEIMHTIMTTVLKAISRRDMDE